MVKIIDIDELFDNYISGYVYSNVGKVKPEEIENKIPILYSEFGKAPLKELDGKTPEEYYTGFSASELLDCLKGHLEKGVAVSDFLCEALINDKFAEDVLIASLEEDSTEEFMLYVINILSDRNSRKAVKKYLQLILWDYSETIKELSTESSYAFAEDIKEDIIAQFKDADEKTKDYLTDILSHTKGDDRVFNILIDEFVKHTDNVPLYAGYLAKFGDEKALPFLKTLAESDKINYVDYEELRFAIESLGGECPERNDFDKDPYYKKIKNAKHV